MNDLQDFLVGVFLIEVLLSIIAYIRIIRIYREEEGWRSILWRTLIGIFGVAVGVGLFLAPVGVLSLLDMPRLPFTGPGISIGVMLLLGGVIIFWIQIERLRRRGPIKEEEDRAN